MHPLRRRKPAQSPSDIEQSPSADTQTWQQIPYAPKSHPEDHLAFRVVGLGAEACAATEDLYRQGYGSGRTRAAGIDFLTWTAHRTWRWLSHHHDAGDYGDTSRPVDLAVVLVSANDARTCAQLSAVVAACRSNAIPTVIGAPYDLVEQQNGRFSSTLAGTIAEGATLITLPAGTGQYAVRLLPRTPCAYRGLVQVLTGKYLYFGFICLDWTDLRAFLGTGRTLHLGLGSAVGRHRVRAALRQAIGSLPGTSSERPSELALVTVRWGRDARQREFEYLVRALMLIREVDARIIGDFFDFDSDGILELMLLWP